MANAPSDIRTIDLCFKARPRAVATGLLPLDNGVALVDPGPASSLPELYRGLEANGIGLRDIQAILLTHIHLDHAGATGTLLRDAPHAQAYVSARGAPHLIDPSRLVRSARRIYGDRMDSLWGEIAPVPSASIVALDGGEQLEVGGRGLRVAYTPGHAVHHVSYLDTRTGTAFVGDTTGGRYAPDGPIVPFTPPPDIDLESWRESLAQIRAWRPTTLFLTHFDAQHDVETHLEVHETNLFDWAERVRKSLASGRDDESIAAAFADQYAQELESRLHARLAAHYIEQAGAYDSWFGLARYWRGRENK
jgi:glyoxylase-like metal-dependent hydrolase (beta-lactamase superfamily II)